MEKKKFVSWTHYDQLARSLVNKIPKVFHFVALYAIGRGGLVLGTHMSHLLDLPLGVLMAKRVSYSPWNSKVQLSEIITVEDINNKDGYVLFVDEIIDTGVTKKEILKINGLDSKKVKFASLFVNSNNCPVDCYPDYYVEKVSEWVVFPWEKYGLSGVKPGELEGGII